MTQQEIKKLASEIVGDCQTPNRFFVTACPYLMEVHDFGQLNTEMIEGFSSEDAETQVFDTFEEARAYYDDVDLDPERGVGTVILEDRMTGIICEKFLEKVITVDYVENGSDDSKYFGYIK